MSSTLFLISCDLFEMFFFLINQSFTAIPSLHSQLLLTVLFPQRYPRLVFLLVLLKRLHLDWVCHFNQLVNCLFNSHPLLRGSLKEPELVLGANRLNFLLRYFVVDGIEIVFVSNQDDYYVLFGVIFNGFEPSINRDETLRVSHIKTQQDSVTSLVETLNHCG